MLVQPQRWLPWALLAAGLPLLPVSAELMASQAAGVYYDKRLYLFGGFKSLPGPANATFVSENYSLFLDNRFSTHNPLWEASFIGRVDAPIVAGATATLIRQQDDTPIVVVAGGDGPPEERTRSSFSAYNFKTGAWTRWGIAGDRLYGASAVYAPQIGQVVYFGGQLVKDTGPVKDSETGQLHLFDPDSLAWNTPNLTSASDNAPSPRYLHQSVMVNLTHMAVIGGCGNNSMVDPGTVYLYDTVRAAWTHVSASGAWFPGLRLFGIASYFGRIIVTGGLIDMDNNSFFGDVAILDTDTWTWSRPPLPDASQLGMGRYGHASTLIGKYLVSSLGVLRTDMGSRASRDYFGNAHPKLHGTSNTPAAGATPDTELSQRTLHRRTALHRRADQPSGTDQLVVLDVAAWKTVESFDLNAALSGREDPVNSILMGLAKGSASLSAGAIVGIVLGAVAVIASLVLGMWCCKRHRRRQMMLQRTPSGKGGARGLAGLTSSLTERGQMDSGVDLGEKADGSGDEGDKRDDESDADLPPRSGSTKRPSLKSRSQKSKPRSKSKSKSRHKDKSRSKDKDRDGRRRTLDIPQRSEDAETEETRLAARTNRSSPTVHLPRSSINGEGYPLGLMPSAPTSRNSSAHARPGERNVSIDASSQHSTSSGGSSHARAVRIGRIVGGSSGLRPSLNETTRSSYHGGGEDSGGLSHVTGRASGSRKNPRTSSSQRRSDGNVLAPAMKPPRPPANASAPPPLMVSPSMFIGPNGVPMGPPMMSPPPCTYGIPMPIAPPPGGGWYAGASHHPGNPVLFAPYHTPSLQHHSGGPALPATVHSKFEELTPSTSVGPGH
ncbi:hypothetical protein IWQ60_011126 [Tieghemiomyces parasiticus]|uniref:Galactose oxidase n=1 Tax=Tieghemiomyces parasiticus TaxID=78921 RepID=A0A9W7ZPN3_9FUNG|nr:hypothetical protein IWQ60_011126 [Tieghemiomyces parasiticus]